RLKPGLRTVGRHGANGKAATFVFSAGTFSKRLRRKCPMKALLTVLVLALASAVAAGAGEGRADPGPEELTVADGFKGVARDEARLEYIDEPPGKLQELACEATLRDTQVKVRVRIALVYTVALFSDKRQWDPKAVRAAAVRRVTIVPVGADD